MVDAEFWADVNRWPRDTAQFTFLIRAVLEIGKARFPDEWTGKEPFTKPVQLLHPAPRK
jgi:hypothetical protein